MEEAPATELKRLREVDAVTSAAEDAPATEPKRLREGDAVTSAAEEAPATEPKRPREGDAVTSAAAAAAGDPQYTYLSIADALKVPGVRVCLLAVVSEIGPAVRSRGTGEPRSQVSTPPLLSFPAPAVGLVLRFSPDFSRMRDDGLCLSCCRLYAYFFSLVHIVFT